MRHVFMHLSWPLSVLTACLFVCLSDRVFARDLNRPVYAIVCPPCPALPCPSLHYTQGTLPLTTSSGLEKPW